MANRRPSRWSGKTLTTHVLKVGSTQRSFAVEEGFTDLPQFRVFNGCVVNSLSVELGTDNYVTATFGFLGKSTSAFSATSVCAVPTAPAVVDQFFHEGGVFKEGDATVGYLSTIAFELTNNATANNALGVSGVRAITSGRCEVSGTVTGLFEDVTLYNKFVNNTASSLEFTVSSGSKSHTYKFSKLKYTAGDINSSGDAGVTVSMKFTAEFDATDATTLMVTRVV